MYLCIPPSITESLYRPKTYLSLHFGHFCHFCHFVHCCHLVHWLTVLPHVWSVRLLSSDWLSRLLNGSGSLMDQPVSRYYSALNNTYISPSFIFSLIILLFILLKLLMLFSPEKILPNFSLSMLLILFLPQ